MSLAWICHPISCQGSIVCNAINPSHQLLPFRTVPAFHAALLYNAMVAYACDGRQMSLDDIDRMEDFESRFADNSLNEESFRFLAEEFGDFIPEFLTAGLVDVPQRPLEWTMADSNYPAPIRT